MGEFDVGDMWSGGLGLSEVATSVEGAEDFGLIAIVAFAIVAGLVLL